MESKVIKLRTLRKILSSFDVQEKPRRGKGGHTWFWKAFPDGPRSVSVPAARKDVLPCYVKQCRRAFDLTPEHGVSDDDFYSRG